MKHLAVLTKFLFEEDVVLKYLHTKCYVILFIFFGDILTRLSKTLLNRTYQTSKSFIKIHDAFTYQNRRNHFHEIFMNVLSEYQFLYLTKFSTTKQMSGSKTTGTGCSLKIPSNMYNFKWAAQNKIYHLVGPARSSTGGTDMQTLQHPKMSSSCSDSDLDVPQTMYPAASTIISNVATTSVTTN